MMNSTSWDVNDSIRSRKSGLRSFIHPNDGGEHPHSLTPRQCQVGNPVRLIGLSNGVENPKGVLADPHNLFYPLSARLRELKSFDGITLMRERPAKACNLRSFHRLAPWPRLLNAYVTTCFLRRLADLDPEHVLVAEHVAGEDHQLLVRAEADVWLEVVVVLRHVHEPLGVEHTGLPEARGV